MPDIAMCTRRHCPRRASCYRYVATPNTHRQTYFAPEPDDCVQHSAVLSSDRVRPVEEVDAKWDKQRGNYEQRKAHD